jgi:hypothetical protein
MRPEILSLTEGRSLRQDEFRLIANSASDMSISQLSAFFPPVAKRVSDTWSIPRSAVQGMTGKLPEPEGFDLNGTLLKVLRSSDGQSLVAQIGVTGKFDLDGNPSAFNARIDFTFEPPGFALPPPGKEGATKVVEAAGRITQALLSHATTVDQPDTDGRLKMDVTYELVLERRRLPQAREGEKSAAVAPLVIPVPAPKATKENSWVTYEDAAGRFLFRHPQELLLHDKQIPNLPAVQLADVRPNGAALLGIVLPSARGDTERDLRFRDSTHFQKAIEDQFAPTKDGITWGSADWLADEDWAVKKRKVFRMEGALKREGQPPVYIDFYLIHDDNALKSFSVEAWMGREGHITYRKQVEDVIRSFQWGPAEKRPPGSVPAETTATGPAATAPPAQPDSSGVPPVAPAATAGAPR